MGGAEGCRGVTVVGLLLGGGGWFWGDSHVVKGETCVTPGPVIVPEANAVVSLSYQAHRHAPGDGD
jgi:hypothetical protein